MSRSYRIMLIDDDVDDITLFRKRMPAHYELMSESDPEEAWPNLLANSVDVCFIDYRLGHHDGLKVLMKWRQQGLDIPMVVVTGLDIDTLGENALLAGATDFIAKEDLTTASIERATRWAVIRRHVEKRSAVEQPQWEISELLQPHREALASSSDEPVQRVIYMSRAMQTLSQQGFLNLSAQAAAKNHELGITGVLVSVAGCLVQVLEGDAETLQTLVLSISKDDRHCDMTILLDEMDQRRQFVSWNMGGFIISQGQHVGGKAWIALVKKAQSVIAATENRRAGLVELALLLGRNGGTTSSGIGP